MFKAILVFFGLLIAGMIAFQAVLKNGSFLQYLDDHPNPNYTPQIEYYVGHGYYLFQDLPEAATYFIRVSERYQDSPYADDAYFNYLQCLDDMTALPRRAMAEEYAKYLDRFPHGKSAEMAKNRMELYRSSP